MPQTTIAIVDDHALVRAGLSRLLEQSPHYTVVGTAANAAGAIALVRTTRPDILLLDLSLPDQDGLSIIPQLRTISPTTKIIVISMYDEPEYARAAIDHGACGLVSKAAPPEDLYAAIARARAGSLAPPEEHLTEREREIMALLRRGKEDAEIAAILDISAKTVANYCEHLMGKLGVHTRAGLIAHAKRLELVPHN